MFITFLAAAVGLGEARTGIGPEFTKVLAVARLDVDCHRGCAAAPVAPDRALDLAMATADWRIKKPNDYVTSYRLTLGKYLLDKRLRPRIDTTFTSKDSLYFETALNVLPPYLTCVETVIRSAPDASFANSASIDRLLDKADAACVEIRVDALKRIGFTGPAFHRFNYVADGGKPGAEVSILLQHVQHFVVAYNVGLRGASWRKSIEVAVLPSSNPIR